MKYTVRIQDREYEVHINDLQTRPIRAAINGEVIEVWPEEKSQPESPMQASAAAASQTAQRKTDTPHGSGRNSINAPIPGVIIHIAVKAGDQVEFGQELCTLEAMKMKNAIRSGQPGIIDKVLVSVNDHVNQNQPLMTYHSWEA